MILYHQAFDLYHAIYRILRILQYFSFDEENYIELDRLRIWDFYILFPNKMHSIKLRKRDEKEIVTLINRVVPLKENPFEIIVDERKMFERLQTYQLTALKRLVSYGILDKDFFKQGRIRLTSQSDLNRYLEKYDHLEIREDNIIKLLTGFFYHMPMFGEWGLKNRSTLIETKYDAK